MEGQNKKTQAVFALLGSVAFMSLFSASGAGFFKSSSSDKDDSAEDNSAVTATVDANGVASASVSANSKSAQLIATLPGSSVAGSSVSFPPGSLSIDVTLSIQEGESLAVFASSLPEGTSDPLTAAGPAVVFSPSSPLETTVPMTLALPLTAGALMLNGTDNLAIAFVATSVKDGVVGSVWGLIPPANLKISSNAVSFSTSRFGSFQVVRTPKRLESLVEAVILTPPPPKATAAALHLGLWRSACIEKIEEPDPSQPATQTRFWVVTHVFFGREIAEVREGQFTDATCKTLMLSSSVRAAYGISGDNAAFAGGKNINYVIEKVNLTLHKQEAVDNFNQGQGCGISDWVLGGPRDVTGKICNKQNPSDSSNPPPAGQKRYSVLAVTADTMRLGKGDSTTAEARDTELEPEDMMLRRR